MTILYTFYVTFQHAFMLVVNVAGISRSYE